MDPINRDHIRVQRESFDPAAEQQALRADHPCIGALVSFLGLMRDQTEGVQVRAMLLEHYPGMTERALAAIVADARQRWDLEAVRVVHRVGELQPEEPIVLVAVASRHRRDAFQACEFIIDYLKIRAPFWKKEFTAQGSHWVEARPGDRAREADWAR